MTKAELMAALEAKSEVISIASISQPQVMADGNNRYLVNIKVSTDNNSINYINRAFYVDDEGGAGEAAYWENKEPYPTQTPLDTFRTKVEAKIEEKIADNTINGATIIEINEPNRTAYVRGITPTGSLITAFITDSNNDGMLELQVTS